MEGALPKDFIKPIDEGIQEALTAGVLAGYPMDDVHIVLYDGSYHDVDSSEMTFRIAGTMAFHDAARKAKPVLLEPVMRVEVMTPTEYVGDVIGNLSSRRGQIQSQKVATACDASPRACRCRRCSGTRPIYAPAHVGAARLRCSSRVINRVIGLRTRVPATFDGWRPTQAGATASGFECGRSRTNRGRPPETWTVSLYPVAPPQRGALSSGNMVRRTSCHRPRRRPRRHRHGRRQTACAECSTPGAVGGAGREAVRGGHARRRARARRDGRHAAIASSTSGVFGKAEVGRERPMTADAIFQHRLDDQAGHLGRRDAVVRTGPLRPRRSGREVSP